jgi:N-acetylglucosaminyldiphosphoundecaprenol N-acetyl-beta-D-mannosaminyltransferase
MSRVSLCGVEIDRISLTESVDCIDSAISRKQNVFVVTPNIDHLVKLQKDFEFQEIYRRAFLSVADGVPLVWASRFLGIPLKGRVNGTDLMVSLCALSAEKGHKVFFLGGRPGAAKKAKVKLESQFPKIKIVGCYAPPLGFEKKAKENLKIHQMIKKAGPDILFVGFGAPKQEKWIYNSYKELNVPVSIGIGVSFELIGGMLLRAPVWMQKSGLEWLWRLISEPRRLWKRYLIDDMQFLRMILKQKFEFRPKNLDLAKGI